MNRTQRIVALISVAFLVLVWSKATKPTTQENREAAATMEVKLIEKLAGNISKYHVMRYGISLSQLDTFTILASDSDDGVALRESLRRTLADSELPSYFWETTPTTRAIATKKPFEFVLVPAPSLDKVHAEPHVFEKQFERSSSGFSTFLNMGKDALLVSPAPRESRDYGHLARFIRNAPAEEGRDLFMHVSKAALARLSDRPMWISTSGLGVYWLHVRLDTVPKYYSFSPYKAPPH